MAQNVGTLVTAAIRPNDSNDPIASAFAYEIKGGLHTHTSTSERDAIIFERREWGMMCYVTNDNKTYQLKYNYVDDDIMNNSNWVEFSGSGGSGNEWIDSVLSIEFQPPATYSVGDRYLAGTSQNDSLLGDWTSFNPGVVLEWNSVSWQTTTPTDGMSVRVDDKDNAIYRYEGTFPTGEWAEEKLGQIRSIDASSTNGQTYTAETLPEFDNYVRDMMFLTKFDTSNAGATVSININSMGFVDIRKPSSSGLTDLVAGDIIPDITYSLVYNGSVFELIKHYTGDSALNIRYYIEPDVHVVVPPYHQYWVYGNLTIDGEMTNYGQVIIANGNLINSGDFYNYGDLYFIQFDAGPGPIVSPLSVGDYDGQTFPNISSIKFRGGSVTTPTGPADSVTVTGDTPNEVIVWIPAPSYQDGINIPNETFTNRYVSLPTTEGNPYYAGSMAGTVDKVTRDNELVYNIPSFGYFDDNANFEIEFIDWDETTVLDSLYFTMSDVSVGLTISSLSGIEFNLTDKSNDADRRKATAVVTFNLNTILNGTPRAGGKARTRISFTDSGGDNNNDEMIDDFFYDPDGSLSNNAIINGDVTIQEKSPVIKNFSGVSYYDVGSSFTFSVFGIDDLNDRSYPIGTQNSISNSSLSKQMRVTPSSNFLMSGATYHWGNDFINWTQDWNISDLSRIYTQSIANPVSIYYTPDFIQSGLNLNDIDTSNSDVDITAKLFDWVGGYEKTSNGFPSLIDIKSVTSFPLTGNLISNPLDGEYGRIKASSVLTGTSNYVSYDSSLSLLASGANDELQYIFGRIIFPQHDFTQYNPVENSSLQVDYSTAVGSNKTLSYKQNIAGIGTDVYGTFAFNGYRWHVTGPYGFTGYSAGIAGGVITISGDEISEYNLHSGVIGGAMTPGTGDLVILLGLGDDTTDYPNKGWYFLSNNPDDTVNNYKGRVNYLANNLNDNNSIQFNTNNQARKLYLAIGISDTSNAKKINIKSISITMS